MRHTRYVSVTVIITSSLKSQIHRVPRIIGLRGRSRDWLFIIFRKAQVVTEVLFVNQFVFFVIHHSCEKRDTRRGDISREESHAPRVTQARGAARASRVHENSDPLYFSTVLTYKNCRSVFTPHTPRVSRVHAP